MKTVFAGTTDFGIPALEVLKRDFGLALVVTQPDRPVGRKQSITPPPVKVWAQANGIRVIQPEKIADAAEALKEAGMEAMVVAAYGQVIPKPVLEIPAKGSVNLHASLLPKYRGASPIQAALMNGDPVTGVTVMLMDEKLDHGPILSLSKVTVDDADDFTSLHAKLAAAAATALAEALPGFLSGQVKPLGQDHAAATFTRTIRREHARIDWTRPAREIHNMVRALNPEPGTWTTLGGKTVKILKASPVDYGRVELPGTVIAAGRDCLAKCGDYALRLELVQAEGGKPVSGRDFLNGIAKLQDRVFK